jgi:hypothetical protein
LPRAAICRFAVRPRSGSVTQPADLKHHAGLAHLPSRRFTANAAGLALVGIAYNLARWTAKRRRPRTDHHQDPAPDDHRHPRPSTTSARRLRLRMPTRWPTADHITTALTIIRAIDSEPG